MKIVSVISQKGGSGKTTLTANLSVIASLKKKRVLLLDTDPQKSLYHWWERRTQEMPNLADIGIDDLEKTISNLKKDSYDMVFIDTPPHTSKTINSVVNVSDLILIPVKPSPNDLRAVGNTISLIKNKNKKFIFVINQANKQATITLSTATELSRYGEVCTSIIANRLDYITSLIDGHGVLEMKGKNMRSVEEVEGLFKYINDYK